MAERVDGSEAGGDDAPRASQLAQRLGDPQSPLSADGLLDALLGLVHHMSGPQFNKIKPVKAFLDKYTEFDAVVRSLRLKKEDFDVIKVIGRGAYGEVQLVKHRETKEVFALKQLSKCEMLKKADTAFFWEERDIMCQANSPWIVNLHYAFQDDQYIYMAMDYMAGGDLVTLQENYDFPEDWARFYTAEVICAVSELHELGYVHRDIKPDNILLDGDGHLKLADFGTCVKTDAHGLVRSDAAVGTPDYISPEVLESQNGNGLYGRECDWWSVGVFLYELLCGDTPFYNESLLGTYGMIMNHTPDTLKYPDDVDLSDEVKDLLKKLLCRKEARLGTAGGAKDIMAHPFFKGVDWANLRESPPPIVPEIASIVDTSHFPELQPAESPPEVFRAEQKFTGTQLPFIGFTFVRGGLLKPSKKETIDWQQVSAGGEAIAQIETLQASLAKAKADIAKAKKTNAEQEQELAKCNVQLDELQANEKDAEKRSANQAGKELKLAQLELKELQSQLAKAQQEKEKLEASARSDASGALERQEQSRLEAEALRKVKAETAALHAELDAARELQSRTKDKFNKHRVKLDNAELEVSELKLERDSFKRQFEQAKKTLGNHEATLEDTEYQLAAEKRKRSNLQERNEELEEHNSDLKKKAADSRTKFLGVQGKLDELQEAYYDLEDSNERLQRELKLAKEREATLEKQRDASTPSSPSAEGGAQETSRLEADLANVTAQLQSETHSRDVLHAELAEANHLIEQLKSKKALRRRDSAAEEKTAALEVQAAEHATAMGAVEAAHKATQATLAQIQTELEGSQRSQEGLKTRLQEQEQETETLAAEVADLKRERDSLTSTSKQQQEANEELQAVCASRDEKVQALQAEVQQLSDAAEQLTAMKEKMSDTEDRLIDCTNELAQAEARAGEATDKSDDLERQLERLKIESEHQTSEFLGAQEDKAELKAELSKFKERALAEEFRLKQLLEEASKDSEEAKERLKLDTGKMVAQLSARDMEVRDYQEKMEASQAQVTRLKKDLASATQRTQQAVEKLLAADTKKTKASRSKGDLQTTVRRLNKAMKALELSNSKLQKRLEQQEADFSRQTNSMQEDLEVQVRKVQAKYQQEVDNVNAILSTLKEELKAKVKQCRQLQSTVDTISLDGDAEEEGAPISPRVRKALSFSSDIIEGHVLVPNRNNIKKYGWLGRYLKLDPDGMLLFKDLASVGSGTAEVTVAIEDVHHCKPALQTDVIHAKAEDVPKIFVVVVAPSVKAHMRNRAFSSAAPNDLRRVKRKGSAYEHQAPIRSASFGHKDLIPPGRAGDGLSCKGHVFEKTTMKKNSHCVICHKQMWSRLTKTHGYECSKCHMVMHMKHLDNDTEMIAPCVGNIEVIKYMFQAPSVEERERWCTVLANIVKRRGMKKLDKARSARLSPIESLEQSFQDTDTALDDAAPEGHKTPTTVLASSGESSSAGTRTPPATEADSDSSSTTAKL